MFLKKAFNNCAQFRHTFQKQAIIVVKSKTNCLAKEFLVSNVSTFSSQNICLAT